MSGFFETRCSSLCALGMNDDESITLSSAPLSKFLDPPMVSLSPVVDGAGADVSMGPYSSISENVDGLVSSMALVLAAPESPQKANKSVSVTDFQLYC